MENSPKKWGWSREYVQLRFLYLTRSILVPFANILILLHLLRWIQGTKYNIFHLRIHQNFRSTVIPENKKIRLRKKLSRRYDRVYRRIIIFRALNLTRIVVFTNISHFRIKALWSLRRLFITACCWKFSVLQNNTSIDRSFFKAGFERKFDWGWKS